MPTRFSVPPLHEVTRELTAVARGEAAPDCVLTDARILSTYSERILDGREVLIAKGRIAAVLPVGTTKQHHPDAPAYSVDGGILAPGLVDPHIHIESSMMTACAYAEAALLNGTTTIFCDSHEIGNVCGADGVVWMLEDAREAPLNIFLTVPSTVPATTDAYETAGGAITPDKLAKIFDEWPEAVALGEKMDFVQVSGGDSYSHSLIATSLQRGRPVCGHCYGREFVPAYAASGVTDTHEAIDREIANDFLEAGLWVFVRGGPPTTQWHSLPEAIKVATELGAALKRICVCTDDRDADDLFLFGMDWVARQAVKAGVSPAQAWSLGSLHPATRYGFDGEFGALGHSRRADIVCLNDDLEVQHTWYGGELAVEDKKITSAFDQQLESKRYVYPKSAYTTVTVPESPRLIPQLPSLPCTITAMEAVTDGQILVRKTTIGLSEAPQSWASFNEAHGACHIAVIERHGNNGNIAHGVLLALGIKNGAVISSVGHDAHNLIVAGSDESNMRVALDAIVETQGGVAVVIDGELVARVTLPVAGLLSDKRAPDVAEETKVLKEAWAKLGCTLPYMGFNLLSLSVIPEIRLTDVGLVEVPSMNQPALIS
ncbi:MAG: adenine deaminase C-terminal domain-containing protein [Opitutales bacterium]